MQGTLRWFAIASVTFVTACSDKTSTSVTVSGSIKNIDYLSQAFPEAANNGAIKLMLFEVATTGDGQPILMDSAKISGASGSFTLKGKPASGSMYEIGVDKGPWVPLINDASDVTVDLDFADMNKYYSVKGSDASVQLRDFIFIYGDHNTAIRTEIKLLDSLRKFAPGDSAGIAAAQDRRNASMVKLKDYLKQFLANANQPALAAFALGRSAQILSHEDFEANLNRLVQKFPNSEQLNNIKQRYDVFKKQSQADEKRSWVGKPAPELTLPDINGKNVSIASYKGKYVLVDFWASWCGPCRAENPNVVYAYNQFKDKNFTVLGVSLDKDKDNWIKAINQDHLTWMHISDLAYWDSKAVKTFGFNGIPFNVLVDPNGNVIGQSLRGEELLSKLQEVLK